MLALIPAAGTSALRKLADLRNRSLFDAILVNHLPFVQHVELFRGILAGVDEDGLFAAGMVVKEFRDIEDLAIDDDPAVILLVVLGYLRGGWHCYVRTRTQVRTNSRSRS